jgi:site-specific recombinase XerD
MTQFLPPGPPRENLEQILEDYIQSLAGALQTQTLLNYQSALHRFLSYLHITFPQVRHLSQLHRDPHMLGWFRWLCEHDPPLSTTTRNLYLRAVRRLFQGLAANGPQHLSGLIVPEDIPRLPQYLPRSLSPQDDQLLQEELRRTDDVFANALLLIRLTGIRLGECIHLALDCLWPLDHDQWALHVPLGKLNTERLVPVDEEVRQIVSRILTLRARARPSRLANSASWLLPRLGGFFTLRTALRDALVDAAKRAGCSRHLTVHQLRHTFATEMLRLGVSLPALMRLLGHTHLQMTLRYLQVTQQDLQREFHLARQKAVERHIVPKLPLPDVSILASPDLPGICRSLVATRRFLEIYRRHLADDKTRQKIQRLDKRLLNVGLELGRLLEAGK